MEVARGNGLGFGTVFYHEKTGKFGTSVNEVIDYGHAEIDPEGLAAYLDYGYCVFGRTPVRHVKFLLPNESLHHLEDGKIRVEKRPDSIARKLGVVSHPDDVLGMLEDRVRQWEDSFDGDFLIPTSGGFDSRLLNVLIRDKSRIRSYTYGVSRDQSLSREAVYAQALSERLGTYWRRVELGRFNRYIPDWYDQFGPTVAAVGTYHIEFYEKIRTNENRRKLRLLSGIVGDIWAGAVSVPELADSGDYLKLGHTHGMRAEASQIMPQVSYRELVESIYAEQKDLLRIPEYRIITLVRTKMMLLQFLVKLPQAYGFEAYSPFLEEDVAVAMLNLPAEQRANRKWQCDFFRSQNLLFEEESLRYTYQNSLNYAALLNERLEPINATLLQQWGGVNSSYLAWINGQIARADSRKQRFLQTLMHTPKVKELLRRTGFRNRLLEAYFAYITIKPIEILLSKINDA